MTHEDSMGNIEILGPGSIQAITAGTFTAHSEFNENSSKQLRFLQMWFDPKQENLPCEFCTMKPKSTVYGEWVHLVTDVDNPADIPIKVSVFFELGDCGLLTFLVDPSGH